MRTRIDFKRLGRQIAIFLFILILGLLNLKAQLIYSEDFSTVANGSITSPKWEMNMSSAAPDLCWVTSERFECKNLRGEVVWKLSLIDITGFTSVKAAVSLFGKEQMDAADYIRVYYNVDGKGEVLFAQNGNMQGAFISTVAQQTNISGNDLQISIRVNNNQFSERHAFDNIVIESETQSFVWTGSMDGLWSNAANWSLRKAPSVNDNVIITAQATLQPLIDEPVMCNSIRIEKGASLTMINDAELNLLGDFICMGKFKPGKAMVICAGSQQQRITVSGNAEFYNLGIQNRSQSGVHVDGNIRVRHRLHLADGILIADSVLVLNDAADAITGFSDSSYVAGKLLRKINSKSEAEYHFPVGLGGKNQYHPARILANNLESTSALTVSFEEAQTQVPPSLHLRGSDFSYDYLVREGSWFITPDAEPVAGWYDIKLSLQNISALVDNLFGIVKRPQGAGADAWAADFGTESVFGGEGRKLSDGCALKKYCTGFSEFSLAGGGVPIPIELLDFKAELAAGKVNLNWSTATETNNAYFTIEKSNGTDFREVAKIDGEGNSSSLKTYAAVDEKPYTGISYYRLKQTDFNGKESYSDIASVKNVADNQLVVFPNPAEGSVKLKFNAVAPQVDVVIYNQHGSVSFNKTYLTYGANTVLEVQLKDELAPGVYYMQVSAANQDMLIQQIVIQ
ncbi:MAG: T9SS type A sorting domain-containing protein [Chitinophagales bacterium]|nr:T9SS type A sorting domain-containing protein [Chitinophagales bacterium]